MQFAKRFVVMLMAVLSLGTVVATTAYAEETLILPAPRANEPLEVVSKSGSVALLTVAGDKVTCEKSKGSSKFTTANLGTFKITLEGCKSFVVETLNCKSTGDLTGIILMEGEVHYVLALRMKGTSKTETELVAALAYLIKEFHFTCKGNAVTALVLLKGCVAALAEPTNILARETKDIFEEFSSGQTRILEVLMENATSEIKCLPEANINETRFELFAVTSTITNEKLDKGAKEIEIELMNP